MEMENQGTRPGTTDARTANRKKKMNEGISSVEFSIEETDTSVKEITKLSRK